MYSRIRNLSLRIKIVGLTALTLVGLAVFAVTALNTLELVKVNGPLYKTITEDKDLIADLLPPPLYIVESYLVVHRMLGLGDKAKLDTLVKQSAKLSQEYDARLQYWEKTLPAGKRKDSLMESFKLAGQFFEVRDKEFIPAILSGDQKKANDLVEGKLNRLYEEHRTAIEQTVTFAQKSAEADEKEVQATIDTRMKSQLGPALVVVFVSMLLAYWLSRYINNTLNDYISFTGQIANGDLTGHLVPKSDDELGALGKNFNVMLNYLSEMASAAEQIAQGNLGVQVKPESDKDLLGTAFARMVAYLKKMAGAAEQIAQGNLGVQVKPESDKDILGTAFARMTADLNEVVRDIVHISEKLAAGDLTAAPQGQYSGEFVKIKTALEAALDGLNGTMRQTNLVVTQVNQAVDQVRSASEGLASTAQEQASAVDEVASNLQRTDGQVKNTAENAGTANQLASQTSNLAEAGQEKMKSLSDAMNAIAQSSEEIAKIIKVIDEIAFQTNLLALNAAVEAARAGQHGRGFAVVAQEVRNLAERSAKAAKSTAELIDESGRRTRDGVAVTVETMNALTEIVQNVLKVKDLVGEIAAATEDQSKSLAQINIGVAQVNQGTQSASSQSEELASTSDELGGLADRLRQEVERFKLRDGNGSAMYLGGLPAGLTPEMLQVLQELAQQKDVQVFAAKTKERDRVSSIDRDARGYGQF